MASADSWVMLEPGALVSVLVTRIKTIRVYVLVVIVEASLDN
jgi:hypothetical protein